MDTSVLDRRGMLRGVGAAGAAVVGGVALAAPAAAEGGGAVIGSWLISHQDDGGGSPPVKGVVTFAPGGVFTNVDIAPAGDIGAGAWAAGDEGRFRATFWSGGTDPQANQAFVARIRVRGRARRGAVSGTYSFTVWSPDGVQLGEGTGTFSGTRITA